MVRTRTGPATSLHSKQPLLLSSPLLSQVNSTTVHSGIFKRRTGYKNTLSREKRSENPEILPEFEPRNSWIRHGEAQIIVTPSVIASKLYLFINSLMSTQSWPVITSMVVYNNLRQLSKYFPTQMLMTAYFRVMHTLSPLLPASRVVTQPRYRTITNLQWRPAYQSFRLWTLPLSVSFIILYCTKYDLIRSSGIHTHIKLSNWETQDGSFWAFAFSGWISTRQQIAKFNKKFPYANGT